MPHSPPPGSMLPDPNPKLPGKVGIWIGVLLMIGGVVLGAALIVGGARSLLDGVDELTRLPIRTGGTVQVDEPGTIAVYVERPAFGSSGSSFETGGAFAGPSVGILVTAPDGSPVPVAVQGSNRSYTWDGREGIRIATFGAEEPGTYRIETVINSELLGYSELAVGPDVDFGGVAGILGGIFGGGLIVVVGIIVLIVSAVRRSRARTRLRPTYPGGPGGPVGPGAPVGTGWAPPPVAVPTGYGPPPTPGYAPPPAPPGPPGGFGPPSTYVPPAAPPWAPPGAPGAPGTGEAPGWVPPPAPPPPGYGQPQGPPS